MRARVTVRLKDAVLDPAGEAVGRALSGLGYAGVGKVRIGKIVELDLDAKDAAEAEKLAGEMADKLLANPVIERFDVEVLGESREGGRAVTVAVVTFPGSNCDADCRRAIESVGAPAARAWHKDTALPPETRAVILPGGFSYGDYLRCGSMAALSPLMSAVRAFAEGGGAVLGICNGFQVLCELGLLEGALMHNKDGRFVCKHVELEVAAGGQGLLRGYRAGETIRLPVAHGEGNYFAEEGVLDGLEGEGRVAFRYAARDDDGHGAMNGSRRAIAGLVGGPKQNVVGLMPHPERRAEARLGGEDGRPLLEALARADRGGAA